MNSFLKNVRVTDKAAVMQNADVLAAVKQASDALGDTGRILVRASGTEPLIRVMVEGQDQEEIAAMAQNIADTIRDRLEIK